MVHYMVHCMVHYMVHYLVHHMVQGMAATALCSGACFSAGSAWWVLKSTGIKFLAKVPMVCSAAAAPAVSATVTWVRQSTVARSVTCGRGLVYTIRGVRALAVAASTLTVEAAAATWPSLCTAGTM